MCFSASLEFIVSGTYITQTNQFSLVDLANMLNTMSQTYGLQYTNGYRAPLPECHTVVPTGVTGTAQGGMHSNTRAPQKQPWLGSCLRSIFTLDSAVLVLLGSCLLPFSETVPLGKPSQGVRSMSHWAIPRAPAVPVCECVCGLPQCWQRPSARAMEGFGSSALLKPLETDISFCSQTEQRSIIPDGDWWWGAGQERGGCKALVLPS